MGKKESILRSQAGLPEQKSGGAVIRMSSRNNKVLNILRPGVTLLAGAAELSMEAVESFESTVIEFLTALSDRIKKIPREEASEEMKALGFWLRRAHLQEMRYEPRIGLGLTYHITPSNVPLMFFYSCAIGLLAGNSCLVRLSDRRAETDLELCRIIDEVLAEDQFLDMKNLGRRPDNRGS